MQVGEIWPDHVRRPALVLLVLLGASLYGAHTHFTQVPWLGFFSTVPWLLLTLHPKLKGNIWIFSAVLYLMLLISVEWLRTFNIVSWLVAPVFYLPFSLPLFWLTRTIRRRWPTFPLALLWPLIFTGVEWFRIRYSPGGMSFAQLGYSQIYWPKLVQIADVAGVSAISFMLCSVAGLITDAILVLWTCPKRRSRIRHLVLQAIPVATLCGAVIAYGYARDNEAHFSPGPTFHVIQPALSHAGDSYLARRNFWLQAQETVRTWCPARDEAVFWPENSVNDVIHTDGPHLGGYYGMALKRLSAQLNQPILVDGQSFDRASGLHYRATIFVKPSGDYEIYHRVQLVPWSEYVPLRSTLSCFGGSTEDFYLRIVKALTGHIPNFKAGEPQNIRPFHLVTHSGQHLIFGTPVCGESSVPRVVNRWNNYIRPDGTRGVDFLVNPTSEGLLGSSIHEQMLTMCRFRAIEGRVSIVRASNVGISAMIDPNGRVREVLRGSKSGAPLHESGAFYPRIILDSRRGTFYARFGDFLPIGCLLISLTLFGVALCQRRSTRP